MKTLMMFLAVLILLSGCTSPPPPKQDSPKPAAATDPVTSLKEIAARIEREGATTVATDGPQNLNQPYGRTGSFVASNIVYDVKKTDSLVSPYTAVISFVSVNRTPMKVDEKVQFRVTASLVQQDGVWVVKGIERQAMIAPDDPDIGSKLAALLAPVFIEKITRYGDQSYDAEVCAWWRTFGGR